MFQQLEQLYILREINLAIVYKAECNSDAFIKWGISLLLLSKCIIWGARNTKIQVESLFKEQTCIGFVPMVSNKKVSSMHYETHMFDTLFHRQILHQSQFAALYTFVHVNKGGVLSVKRILPS